MNPELGPSPEFGHQPELEVIGLKEALKMLDEADADDAAVLEIIDEALLAPVPHTDDEAAWLNFRDQMRALADFATTLDASTARNRELREKIQSRLAQLGQLDN